MTEIKASSFHPMAGHVYAGAIVRMSDGTRVEILHDMRGWRIVDYPSDLIYPPSIAGSNLSAYDVAAWIARRDGASS